MNSNSVGGLRIAVTGLNATDNPGPGVGVIRCLRQEPGLVGSIIGLAYDALDPGAYDPELADQVYLMPLPSEGRSALLARLTEVIEEAGIDVLLPTIDAELPAYIELEQDLAERGVHTFLPSRAQFDLRSKVRLEELGRRSGVPVPKTRTVSEQRELFDAVEDLGLPLVVKGLFYGATVCRSPDEAISAMHRTASQWGLPIVVQEYLEGEEYDVVALGDGRGRTVGAVPMKKLYLTDKGKAWAGLTVGDPKLIELTEGVVAGLEWKGPCEVELLINNKDNRYYLLEINPRFPAWVYLSAAAGQNLPAACVRLALGQTPDQLAPFSVGTMFVRISVDQIANFSDFESITAEGRILRQKRGGPR